MDDASHDRIVRAIELMVAFDSNAALAALKGCDDDIALQLLRLVDALERREDARRRATAEIRHELGNALSIARANLEGVADGVLEATPERLDSILETLARSSELLEKMRRLTGA